MSAIQDSTTPQESVFRDTVESSRKNSWIAHITINGTRLLFKLDTGAEVTAISKEAWEMIGKPALQTPGKQLFGPAQHPLEQFCCHLTHKGKEAHQPVYVVSNLKTNLPGLPAITTLARMDSCENPPSDTWERKFPKVFKGLGTSS